MGMATLMFLTAAQSMVQLTTPDGLRGRVSGIYNLVFIGGGAIGGPLVGLIAQNTRRSRQLCCWPGSSRRSRRS